jgi:hypothetical protein
MGKRTRSGRSRAAASPPRTRSSSGCALGALVRAARSTVNVLTAALALVGNLFYVLVYTRWLKRSTPQNIVIGGAAGAVPPLVGYAAATRNLALPALWLFLIVFLWTPPHFWALALLIKENYARRRCRCCRSSAATRRRRGRSSCTRRAGRVHARASALARRRLLAAAARPRRRLPRLAGSSARADAAQRRRRSSTTRSSTWRCSSSRRP